MRPATAPREVRLDDRLLVIDPSSEELRDGRVSELVELLRPGDLVVVNDAGTLPASFSGRTASGAAIELRLLGEEPSGAFAAVLLGEGDWRTPTEHRPAPPAVSVGETLHLRGDLHVAVVEVSKLSPRLLRVAFDHAGDALWSRLYAWGRPIQYAHVPERLDLWSVQTTYASRPVAVEMPSAGRPLRAGVLLALRRRGVALAALTHAAGVSATGDPAIDAALPLPEWFELPEETVAAIAATRARGGRVVAVGTSVVRALEGSAAKHGSPRAGRDETDLVIGPGFAPRVVDGLLTGMHERKTSHFELLAAFAPRGLLERALAHAATAGYRGHEFGDACWIAPRESRVGAYTCASVSSACASRSYSSTEL